jgi:hypothetical protein
LFRDASLEAADDFVVREVVEVVVETGHGEGIAVGYMQAVEYVSDPISCVQPGSRATPPFLSSDGAAGAAWGSIYSAHLRAAAGFPGTPPACIARHEPMMIIPSIYRSHCPLECGWV